MVGFECTSKFHYGDKWVGDPNYKHKSEDSICLDCHYCERKNFTRARIPPTRAIQALTGVSARTARRRRAKARETFKEL